MAFERSLHTKKMSSRSMPPPGMTRGNTRSRFTKDFTPVTWQHYFEKCEDIQVGSDTFRVYESGCEGPAVIFLHGGGHSSLSWAVLSASLSKIIKCRILAIDSRGHGNTQTTNDDDLSANVLSRDIGNVVDAFYGDEVPHIILVGH
ncbi:protein phosphatase methylesterase 1-like, partial [Saccoglossus kowalevskii]|uniref:protein phosphatase methylesterase-1 n=1 Tax=Saccoglossus kowalevskii TaxID=10224 RepID=A0ABM0GL06_SACKO